MRSSTITGFKLNNWTTGAKTETLLHKIMSVEIIVNKKIVKGKKSPSADNYSMLLFLIKHQSQSRFTTLVQVHKKEGVWLAACHYSYKTILNWARYFFNSKSLTMALEGNWEFKARNVCCQKIIECDRLDVMEDDANAYVNIFISKDQQQVLALDDTTVSEETWLKQGLPTPFHM